MDVAAHTSAGQPSKQRQCRWIPHRIDEDGGSESVEGFEANDDCGEGLAEESEAGVEVGLEKATRVQVDKLHAVHVDDDVEPSRRLLHYLTGTRVSVSRIHYILVTFLREPKIN